MADAGPFVSVVIPTYQRRQSLLRALAALAAQDVAPETFEVIVSVDGSTDGTSEALAALAAPYALRVVSGSNRGRATACNAGIGIARGDVIVILDDDMEPARGCLRNHRRNHPPGSRVCVVGAVPVRLSGARTPVALHIARRFDAHLTRLSRPDHVFALRDFYSGNASIRKDVLLEVGRFQEAFTHYGNEDLELALRLRRCGVTIRFDGEARAVQHYDKTFSGLARDTAAKGRTAVLFTTLHPEVFDELQLAEYGRGFPRWRILRASLLALTRRVPAVTPLMLRVAQALERAGAWRHPLFYVLALDYFYWAGVASALADSPERGPIGTLAADLRRGPIRLLLHR